MLYAAVTTYARRHWDGHARRMVATFREHWPAGVPLTAWEDADLAEVAPGLVAFKARHKEPAANGRRKGSYDVRWDAVRFSHKVFAIGAAAERCNAEVLIWIDADTVTHAPVTPAWLDALIGAADVACLLRDHKYTECGFVMYRLSAAGRELIRRLVALYETDALFDLPEWHDSFAFDHVRKEMQAERRLTVASLSGAGSVRSHPMANGPVGQCCDHLKGRRKLRGRPRFGDLMAPRSEPYWQAAR